MCYKINPVLGKAKTEEIRFEIDRDFGPDEEEDLMHSNTNLKYSGIDN